MSLVAHRPERPAQNPARGVSMNAALRGRVLRLEHPEEIDGVDWDGPVYAILNGEPKHLAPTDRSPFVRDDGERVPAWPCKLVATVRDGDPVRNARVLDVIRDETYWIPHWRFTQPRRDLSSEIDERPLLSVFRFARISRYFMASPGDATRLVLQTPGVQVCCQVLTYRSAAGVSLVDDIGVIIESDSEYVCVVSLRRHVADDPVVVAVPLPDIQTGMISAAEFMLGYAHGLAASVIPRPFANGWTAFAAGVRSDQTTTRAQLTECFLSADPVAGPTIDVGILAVPFVTPQGATVSRVPVDFAHQLTQHPPADVDVDDDMEIEEPPLRAPLDGPLLRRADVTLTPAPTVATTGLATTPPDPNVTTPAAASEATAVSTTNVLPQPPAPLAHNVPAGMTVTEALIFQMLREQQSENRRNREATERQFTVVNQQISQFADALTNVTQQLANNRPAIQTQPALQIQGTAHDENAPATAPPIPPTNQTRLPDPSRGRRERTGAAYDADRDDISQTQSPRQREDRGSRARSRSPRERSRGRGRSRSRTRDRSRSHHRGRSRSRGRSRTRSPSQRSRTGDRSRSPARERSSRRRRSRSRDRSPQGRLPTGHDRFRPTTNEMLVHDNARVRPRTGTKHECALYDASDPQDRVRTMLLIEQLRRRYRATRVTTKMLFAVDFFSRPLDHFLPDANQQHIVERLNANDPSHWSGQDPDPRIMIRRTDQLRGALDVIQDAAMCNLYVAVFAAVFGHLQRGGGLRDLEGQAARMLRRDSSEYQRYVGDVLNDAMMSAVLRDHPHPPSTSSHARGHGRAAPAERHGRAAPVERRRNLPSGHTPQQPVLPANLRGQIPLVDGTEVCLRFQTMKDCDFVGCKREHTLFRLPADVVTWLEAKHGSLKSNHPSFP